MTAVPGNPAKSASDAKAKGAGKVQGKPNAAVKATAGPTDAASKATSKPTASAKPAKGVQAQVPSGKALAQGRLDGDGVLVADVAQANRLHNKANAGTPQPGNTLRLSLVEAAYCVSQDWLEVEGSAARSAQARHLLGVADLLAAGAAGGHRAEVDYLAYRDLRERGLVARHAPGTGHFDVWPRGTAQGPAAYQVVACSDTDPATAADFLDGAGGIVCCVVDADATVTHYRVESADPRGAVALLTGSATDAPADATSSVDATPRAAAKPLPHATGRVLADRVLVDDPAACSAYTQQALGTPHGTARLLSLAEADFLAQSGALGFDDPTAFHHATRRQPNHAATVQVLAALRHRGCVAKSGLRFGTHLRAYAGDPDQDHAPWLIQCATPGEELGWSSLARGVRLAHGVRKQFLLAIPTGPGPGGVKFVQVSWFRA